MFEAFSTYPEMIGRTGDPYPSPYGPLAIEGAEIGGDDPRGPSWHSGNMRQVGLPLARRFQHTEGSMTWEWVFRGGEFQELLTEPWVELLYYYPRGALQKPQRLSWYDPSLG